MKAVTSELLFWPLHSK